MNDEKAAFSGSMVSTKKPYKPFGAALHGTDVPPPANSATNSVGLQEAPGQEQKKSKFGKYGNTVSIVGVHSDRESRSNCLSDGSFCCWRCWLRSRRRHWRRPRSRHLLRDHLVPCLRLRILRFVISRYPYHCVYLRHMEFRRTDCYRKLD